MFNDYEFCDEKAARSLAGYRFCYGWVSIGFRKSNDPSYEFVNPFVLNVEGDGWFRKPKDAGISAGYGLCINDIKITTRKEGTLVGSYIAYKAIIKYTTSDFEAEEAEDKFFLV